MMDFDRYSRQIRLPHWGEEAQRRLSQASVLCVGVGGLGSPVALYLAAAGVGTLGLLDEDVVDASNLQRQVLFGDSDVGAAKVEAAAARLRAQNDGVRVVAHRERLCAENAERIVRDYDLMVDGTDSFATKFLVNDVALKLGLPWVFGAVNRFEGQVALFSGREGGPCYRCLLPASPKARIRNCAETGVLGAMVGVIGSMQAMLALQWIGSGGDPAHPLFPVPGGLQLLEMEGQWSSRQVQVKARPDCPCGTSSRERIILSDGVEGCDRVSGISASALEDELGRGPAGPRIIDVREAEELESGFIPGSLHWPLGRLEAGEIPHAWLAADRESRIVAVCRSGVRSRAAALILMDAGFPQVASLSGGMEAWSRGRFRQDPSRTS